MSITDELREYFGKSKGMFTDHVLAIADRIDAEHESACAEAYGNGVMSVPIALDESQWVKLPVDADGVPIRVGDEVVDELDESTEPRKVTSLYLADDGWWVYIGGIGRRPSRYRHHHAHTVEDVLREFADEMNQNLGMYTGEAIDADEWRDADNKTIAEFAAKLRLAEEVDG